MQLKEYQLKILDYHIEKELLLSNLYYLFAQKFPEHKNVWLSASREEREHAGWIKYLEKYALQGIVHFDEGKTKTYTLMAFIKYLDGIIEDTYLDHYNKEKAAHTALDLEKSLLEKNIFNQFNSYSVEIMRYLGILREGMVDHFEKIKKISDNMKKNPE